MRFVFHLGTCGRAPRGPLMASEGESEPFAPEGGTGRDDAGEPGTSRPNPEGTAEQEGPAEPGGSGAGESEDAIRKEAEFAIDEYSDLELKVRADVYLRELRSRKEAARDEEDCEEPAPEGMVRLRGGRLRRARGTAVLTPSEKRKRTLAAEKQVVKLLKKMTDWYGCSAWVLGYTTEQGQLRAACVESMTSWWKSGRVYAAQATKAHLYGRGELQQELTRLESLPFSALLEQLNKKQLSALTSSWIRRASPSSKRYPLDLTKGSPPWWPEGIRYKKTDEMRVKDLLPVAQAAARNVCSMFPAGESILKLEQVLSTSERFSSETARVRAIVHLCAKAATAMWEFEEAMGQQPASNDCPDGQPAGGWNEPMPGTTFAVVGLYFTLIVTSGSQLSKYTLTTSWLFMIVSLCGSPSQL